MSEQHSVCDDCGADQCSVIPDGDGGRRCWGCDGADEAPCLHGSREERDEAAGVLSSLRGYGFGMNGIDGGDVYKIVVLLRRCWGCEERDGEERTMAIKRYEPVTKYIGTGDYVAEMTEDNTGDYVAYNDHCAERDAIRADLTRVERERDDWYGAAKLANEERDAAITRASGAELLYRDAAGQVDALRAEVERVRAAWEDSARRLVDAEAERRKAMRERDEAHNAIGEAQSEIVRLSAPPCDHHEIATLRAAAERVVEANDIAHGNAIWGVALLGAIRFEIDALRAALRGPERAYYADVEVRDGDD